MLKSAKTCTPASRCPVASQKEAAHCSFHHDDAGRSIEFFAEQAGVKPSTFNDQLNPAEETDNLSFRRLPNLIPHLTNFALLDYWEALAGRIAFALPRGRRADERSQASAVKEFGEYLLQSSTASEDGEYTAAEAERIEREGVEAIAAIYAHIETVKSRVRRDLVTPRPVRR